MCALLFGEKNVFESDPQIDDLPSVYFASDGDNKALVIDGVFVDTSSGSSFNLFEVVNTDVSLSVEDYKPAEHFVRMGYDSQTDVITIMSVRSNGNERRTILVEATREDWARATHLSQFEAHLFAAADTAAYAEIAQRSWEWISEHTTEMLDATQHGLTLAGMAPAGGVVFDMANLVINVGRRQWSDAGMDAMGIGMHLYMVGMVVGTGGLGTPLAAEAAAVNIAMRAPRLAKRAKAAAEVSADFAQQVLRKNGLTKIKAESKVISEALGGGGEFVVRINPISGKGPMAIDTSLFVSGKMTKEGGLRESRIFWKKWADTFGDTLSSENLARMKGKKGQRPLSPIVDDLLDPTFSRARCLQRRNACSSPFRLRPISNTGS
jgi:hypothetical protein